VRTTVLVVEDQPEICQSLCEIVKGEGFDAQCASNGLEAKHYLQSLTEERYPCLVQLDLGMPFMDGSAFLDWKEKEPTYSSVPVVIISISGESREKVRAESEKDDVVGSIGKPIGLEKLLDAVEKHCERIGRACSSRGRAA
jgi:DNA-binding response OmpR family regulator